VLCQKNEALQLKTSGVIMLYLVRAISYFRKAVTDEYRTMREQCLAEEKEETWREICPSSTSSMKSSHAVTRPEADARHHSLNDLR